MLTEIVLIVPVGSAIWVYFDAKQLGVRRGLIGSGMLDAGPPGWALGCLLIWIVVFPLYLATRPRYVEISKRRAVDLPIAVIGRPVVARRRRERLGFAILTALALVLAVVIPWAALQGENPMPSAGVAGLAVGLALVFTAALAIAYRAMFKDD